MFKKLAKMKKAVSLALAFAMTLSMFTYFPTPVFADEGGVKSEELAPVVAAKLAGDATLYDKVGEGYTTVDLSSETEFDIELYKKLTVHPSGEVFYQFYSTNQFMTSDLAALFEQYQFVAEEDVVFTAEPVEPVGDELEGDSGNVSTANFGVDADGKYYIVDVNTATNTGIIVKSADAAMTTVKNISVAEVSKALGNIPANSADYLIWGNSRFFDITLTDANGSEVLLAGDVTVTFPKNVIPFVVDEGGHKSYYAYRIGEDGTVYFAGTDKYEYQDTDITATYNGLSVVGFTAMVYEKENSYEFFSKAFDVVSKGQTITLYSNNPYDMTVYKVVNVGPEDKFKVDSKFTATDGANEIDLYYIAINGYEGSNSEIAALANGSYPLLRVSDVIEYVEPTPTPTPDQPEVPDGPPEEIIADYADFIAQSGLLKDFEAAYEMAQQDGIFDYFSDEQKAEIASIKATLEEMAENTADWTEVGVQATVESNGAKLYRNPVTRPDDYVLANKVEPMVDESDSDIEEIEFSEANIIGKYTDKNNNTYFVVDTDNWDVFEGRVPYRYIAQEDITISSKWNSINKPGEFLKENVKLYTGPSEEYDFVEITDGLSRGELDISYEIIHIKYSGEQEKWYWLNTPNWKDENGNSIGYSRYVKAEDVYLVTTMADATGVSVAGDIPDGAALVVAPVGEDATGIDTSKYPIGEKSLFYDISLMLGDNANTQPGEGGITITFPAENIPFETGEEYYIYHVHEGEVQAEGPYVYDGGDITAKFTNLSVIGVTSADGDFLYQPIDPNVQYVFKNNKVRLYLSHIAGNAYKEVNVTSEDIITVEGKYILEDKELMQIAGYLYTGNNQELMEAINHPDFNVQVYLLVNANDVKTYVPGYVPSESEKLYDKLTSVYTKEEWQAIVDEYTEEEFQTLLDGMTTEQQEEIYKFFDKLPTEAEEAYNALLSSTTSAEFKEIYVSLSKNVKDEFTFAQEIQLFQYRLSLLIAGFIDNPEDYEFPGAPVESFTNAAPFVSNKKVEKQTPAVYSRAVQSKAMLADADGESDYVIPEGEGYTIASDALVMKKTATDNGDGTYTLQLEAYTTGTVSPDQELTSVDITFVLDVSGSMKYCLLCGKAENDDAHTGRHVKYDKPSDAPIDSDEVYWKFGNNYYRAYYCNRDDDNHRGWYAFESHNDHRNKLTTLYYRSAPTCTYTNRMDALVDAVKGFIDSTKLQNDQILEDEDKHRIAIVKFASDSNGNIGNDFDDDDYNYSQIVQDLTTVTEDNYTGMKNIIEGLTPSGATRIDYGMNHAKSIVTAASETYPDRKQVVIVFTDGTPTSSQGFNVTVANNAVNYAKDIKDLDATVYSISVANGANVNAGGTIPSFPTKNAKGDNVNANFTGFFYSDEVAGPNNATKLSVESLSGLMNRFMHLLSSNNPESESIYAGQERTASTESGVRYTATGQQNVASGVWSSYYLVPTNADDLTSIFGQISNDVSGAPSIPLGPTTTVKDIVTPQFTIPSDASSVTIASVDCLGYNAETGGAKWSTTATPLGDTFTDEEGNVHNTLTVSGNNVQVTGFDFDKNYVAELARKETEDSETANFFGRKLVITITIEPTDDFLGGNDVLTNENGAGVYDGSTLMGTFAQPEVDVEIKEISPNLENQHIYATNTANIDTMIAGSADGNDYRYEYKLGDDIFDFNGDNNKYVDVTYNVYEQATGGNPIKTLTIFNGQVAGYWNTAEALTEGLTEDKTYYISCTVAPTIAGTYDEVSSDRAPGTVYVYKPTVTFEDKGVYYGQTVPTEEQLDTAYVADSLVWTNSTLNKKSTEVTMSGNEPSLDYKYNLDGVTGTNILTASDIPVDVTVTVTGETTSTSVATVEHQPACDITGADCKFGTNDKGGFLLHVFTPEFDTKDTTAYLGGAVPSNLESLVTNETWKHNSKAPSNMLDDKPTLNFTATAGIGAENGIVVTTNDIPVNVSVTSGSVDYADVVKFNHTSCTDITCNVPADSQPVIHVKTTSLDVSKTVDGTDKTGEFEVALGFKGNEFTENLTVKVDGKNTTLNVVNGEATLNLTLTHGKTVVLTGLPVGTYTATETVDSNRYDTKVNGTSGVRGSVVLVNDAKETISIVNTLKAGFLTITKVIDMPDGFTAPANEKFTIQVKQGDSVIKTVELVNGQTCDAIELVQGTYTVVETVKGTLYGTHASQNQTVTITAGETTNATVTNPALRGSLSVNKVVSGTAANYTPNADEEFEMQVTVNGYAANTELTYKIGQNEYQTTKDGKFSIKANQTAVFENLLVGNGYEVKELLTDGQKALYTPSYNNATGSIAVNGTTATVTNTLITGKLTVKKSVVMPTGFAVPSETFEIQVKQGDTVIRTYNLAHNQTSEELVLVAGDYTVVENLTNDQGRTYTTTYSTANGNVSVAAGQTTQATVTNTAKTGNFSVTKEVVDNAINYDASKDKFTVKVKVHEYTADSYTYKLNGTETTTDVDGEGFVTITLGNNGVALFEDMLVGKEFTVVEVLEGDYAAIYTNAITTDDTENSYRIDANATEAVKVTNTVKTGTLKVTKSVVAEGVDVSNETFAFTVTGPDGQQLEGEKGNFTLKDDGEKVIENVLVGDYTVTEAENDKYSVTVNGNAGNSATVTVVANGTATAAYVNTLIVTELTISKVVTGTGTTHNVQDSFIFDVYKNGVLYTKVVLQAGETVTITGVNVDDTYKVVEDTSWSWRYEATENTPTQIEKTIVADSSKNNFDFSNKVKSQLKWLDNESHCENLFN